MNRLMTKAVFFLTIFVLVFATKVGTVSADGGCVPVYGGGVQCPKAGFVLIEKKVQNPATGVFVDNLGLFDPKYRPQQIVSFQLIVQNSGDQTIDKVTVKDTIPAYLDFMSLTDSNGKSVASANYDAKTRVLTFEASSLAPGSKQVFTLKVRVVHSAVLPQGKTACPVNVVTAQILGQLPYQDDSQLCIEKEMEVPSVPAAGPEHWILSLGGLGSALIIGLYLRKKALIAR